jgi:hypothetical protein
MGCEPILNLAATPDEAVSIICTIADKLYLQLLGEVDVCELCYWPARVLSRSSHRCSRFDLILGPFDMVDLCLWNALSRWCCSWRVFTHPMCTQSIGLGTLTHVCSWSITDCYIIKRHGSCAWYGCWTIKTLVEAEVLYDGFTVSCRGIAVPLIIARHLGVLLLINNYKTSIKLI